MVSSGKQLAATDLLAFMQGGGAAGEIMRGVDWAATPLGPPADWPVALKTLVSVILGSNQAMFVAWGPERTLLYNDRYAAICGARHPAAMGAPFRDVWFDIMDEVTPILERAFAGIPTQMDDIAFILNRNGYPEEAHFAFSYTPVRSQSGAVEGMFCACSETTDVVLAGRRAAAERERQRLMLQHMPGFCALLLGPQHRYEFVNEAYVAIAGQREFIGRTVREVFPDIASQGFYELLDRVYTTGERFVARAAPLHLDGPDGDRFIDFLYEPVRDDMGRVAGIFVGGYDVTEQVRAESALRESEARYRALFEAIDNGLCIQQMRFDEAGRCVDYRLLELNPAFERQTGLASVAGRWVSEVLPDLERHWAVVGSPARKVSQSPYSTPKHIVFCRSLEEAVPYLGPFSVDPRFVLVMAWLTPHARQAAPPGRLRALSTREIAAYFVTVTSSKARHLIGSPGTRGDRSCPADGQTGGKRELRKKTARRLSGQSQHSVARRMLCRTASRKPLSTTLL
jgi:PAS domain-containing protein